MPALGEPDWNLVILVWLVGGVRIGSCGSVWYDRASREPAQSVLDSESYAGKLIAPCCSRHFVDRDQSWDRDT